MEYLVYFLFTFIGIIISTFGAGGSIFVIPILTELLKIPANLATNYSFIIIIVSSIVAVITSKKIHITKENIILLIIPSAIATILSRKFLFPSVSENQAFIMLLVAVFMLFLGLSFLKKEKQKDRINKKYFALLSLVFIGIATGITGLGGGFLIVPALLYFTDIDFDKATQISLVTISTNSLFGLAFSHNIKDIDILLTIKIISITIIGVFIGKAIKRFINKNLLKKFFGIMLIITSVYIIIKYL